MDGLCTTLCLFVFIAAHVTVARSRQASRDLGASFLWWNVPVLRTSLIVSGSGALVGTALYWARKWKLAAQELPPDGPDREARFRHMLRQGLASEGVPTRFTKLYPIFVASSLAAAVSAGIFLGGMRGPPQAGFLSWTTLVVLLVFLAVRIMWGLVRAMPRRRIVLRGLSLGTLAIAIVSFGRYMHYTYYSAMELPPGRVEVSLVDALSVSIRPLMQLLLVFAVFVPWYLVVIRFPGTFSLLLACMMFLVALIPPLDALSISEARGRRVAVGLPVSTPGGLRLRPAPTPVCLTAVAPQFMPANLERLPRLVWEIGEHGQQTLLLDPSEAQRLHPVPVGADPRSYVPPRNERAPVWSLPTGQIVLRTAQRPRGTTSAAGSCG